MEPAKDKKPNFVCRIDSRFSYSLSTEAATLESLIGFKLYFLYSSFSALFVTPVFFGFSCSFPFDFPLSPVTALNGLYTSLMM